MRNVTDLTPQEWKSWETNEIEIDAADEGKVLVLAVCVRTKGQQLRQEGARAKLLLFGVDQTVRKRT